MNEASTPDVRRFLAECTVGDLDDDDATPVADLYGMYIIWSEQQGLAPLAVQAFSAAVREEGVEAERRHSEQVYTGLLPTGAIPIQYILETDKAPSPNSPLDIFPA
ncbi:MULTISPECIES: hypothetical protein [unclassified Arthrobacter]|uniref:hypothetical protein n=1 Tax=unclassified Arthrobacter TaxID=235627 RepID=UPI001D14312A|nr:MULTISPECIES: hypothetical protein [unclassified Arthrobacter]MCC3274416.1 hypothetical protein [Arthrobacter sp. zg-Y20]MCC9177990.1 hypothetical protein [Arthrobacter sp. zg-Y750]MDK1314572.1 hypothetical protein [Arthrobacter sp. zg.Y20]MDK1327460.1 hypothetical protein [Arthrobacter sp. zg-Y1143]WIB07555.1 hypothetical protein QNO06_07565 [Arthrobacter sp. zg-Y20]